MILFEVQIFGLIKKGKIIYQEHRMNKTNRVHFLLILFTFSTLIAFCQNGSVLLVDNVTNTSNANASTVSNAMRCQRWSNTGVCLQCQVGYYFDSSGFCRQIDPYCRQFNQQAGICEDCYQGYTVINGQCVQSQSNNVTDTGCRKWDNKKCVECSQRWYFDQNGKCQQVDDSCRTWNTSGACLSCYNGYQLNQGKCVVNANNQTVTNPLCKKFNGTVCTECSTRAFFNKNNICQEVNPNCNTWDKLTGVCLTCYQGFAIKNGDCSVSNDTSDLDPLCKKFDWQKKVCTECSDRSYKNQQGVCTAVSPQCKTFNQSNCTSCYGGYTLRNGQCILDNQNQNSNNQPTDPGCARWDWPNNKCIQCSTRFYFNSAGVCTQVSDTCNTYNAQTGVCLSCYSGYALNGSICVLSQNGNNTNNNTSPLEANCRNFDRTSNRCLECSYRFYVGSNGICTQVSDQCQTWNSANGNCTSCYSGYTLSNGACTQGSQEVSDPYCARYDSNQKKCLQCSTRYYFNQNGQCSPVSAQCQTWDNSTGSCTSCYSGYTLSNGACTQGSQEVVDPNCARYDSTQKRCLQCSTRYYFNQNGQCSQVSAQCQTWDNSTGSCTSCYSGYTLSNGACTTSSQNEIPEGCSSYNSRSNRCQGCQADYCLSQTNTCVQRPINCQVCEYGGGCARCSTGYQLSNGQCVQNTNSRCLQYQGNQCVQCEQSSLLLDGRCITYEELRRIIGDYWGNGMGGSDQADQTVQATVQNGTDTTTTPQA